MNLLPKIRKEESDQSSILIGDFRSRQYQLLEYFVKLCMEYVSKQNNNYLTINKIEIKKLQNYIGGIDSSFYTSIEVFIDCPPEDPKSFIKFFIPTLMEEAFFILNGNYYCPTLYVLDKPIVIKKKSIKLSSIFNPITIYDNMIVFTGKNIQFNYFLDLIFDENEQECKLKLAQIFGIKYKKLDDDDVCQYFGGILYCEANKSEILEKINSLFFDDYTKLLYQYCYNLKKEDVTLINIIKVAINIWFSITKEAFIDLSFKRVLFLEMILSPLFKKISLVANQVSRGFKVDQINMDLLEIVKHFQTGLSGRFIYESVNAYDATIQHKAHMINPNLENAPSIIANLHPTHFQRICPISVSSQKPGETALLTAETKLDPFGQFI